MIEYVIAIYPMIPMNMIKHTHTAAMMSVYPFFNLVAESQQTDENGDIKYRFGQTEQMVHERKDGVNHTIKRTGCRFYGTNQ